MVSIRLNGPRAIAVALSVACLCTASPTVRAFSSPAAGEVYKEFTRINRNGTKEWRVTDPLATAAGSPGNSPADFLPNPQLPFTIDDLSGAIRAEAVIDYWGGHPGTTGQSFRFNGNGWIVVPELSTTPKGRAECYIQQWNVVVDVPVADLVTGTNVLEGSAARQSCYNFGWGQWGWYMLTVRVYYDPAGKPHPQGAIQSPTPGATVGANPTIDAEVSPAAGADIDRVEFYAYYDGYDTDGDGIYEQYHQSYHRGRSDTEMLVGGHVGTATATPYSVVWDNEWVPDQLPGHVKMQARIRGTDGVWFVTEEIDGLTLDRPGSVRLYKPRDVGERFWTRTSRRNLNSSVTIPDGVNLATAVSARLLVRTWNGVDGAAEPGQSHSTKVNAYTIPLDYGEDHFYSFDRLDVPVAKLKNGGNTIKFDSQSSHHGIEILWPGPAIAVRFNGATPAFCGDGNCDPGEECDDGNLGDGDGCEADCTVGIVQFLKSPQPGEIYKEFTRIMAVGTTQWRVTHPNALAAGSPGNSPADFLPNLQLTFDIDDLEGAVRAEALVDYWGGHVGTIGKSFRFNGNAWIDIPELVSTPTDGECYTQQVNVVRDVPLTDLVTGVNVLEGTSGGQTCYNFGWGQWGWYGLTVRVYYDDSKLHAVGSITAPAPGATLGENPTVSVSAQGTEGTEGGAGVDRVEVLAFYEGYDTDGDGAYTDWQHSYHRARTATDQPISNHVGSASTAPYDLTWDTTLVPNQPAQSVRLVARIRDLNGVWYVTDEVPDLTLLRPDSTVRLYKPKDVPERFWTRQSRRNLRSKVEIPAEDPLTSAVSAWLLIRTWNGIDGSAEVGQGHSTKVNAWTAPSYGENHFYSYDVLEVPVGFLRSGDNTITVDSASEHHGIEVLWPGPALMVRYGEVLPFCGDGIVGGDEACDDGNYAEEDGCNPLCQAEFCGDGVVQAGLSEACDDGNSIPDDACGADCQANFCGDGQVNNGEECDDTNQDDADACGNDCLVNFCGDGQANLVEECDDGNGIEEDACGVDCLLNFCGDGQVNNGEQCDDGNDMIFDGCEPTCLRTVALTLDRAQTESSVTLDWTGDPVSFDVFRSWAPSAVAEPTNRIGSSGNGQWVDPAPGEGTFFYTVVNLCGNGVLEPGETCDDGNNVQADGCQADCTVTWFCGDGEVNPGEECDDGNPIDGDGCQSNCIAPVCGDGILDPLEQCDDGNLIAEDGCEADCRPTVRHETTFFFNGEGCEMASCRAATGYTLHPTLEYSAGDPTAEFNSAGKVNTSASIFGEYGFDSASIYDQMIFGISENDLVRSDGASICLTARRAQTPAADGFRLFTAQTSDSLSYVLLEFIGTDDLSVVHRDVNGVITVENTGSWGGADTSGLMLIQASYDSFASPGLRILVNGVERARHEPTVAWLGMLGELRVGNRSASAGDYHIDPFLVSARSDLDCWDLLAGTCSSASVRCLDDVDCPGGSTCESVVETYPQLP